MTSQSHHLVTVWNPSYAQDAMDEHLAVLIDWAGRALDEQVRAGTETHLYLTDYRSLYVAWVGEITAEHLPREQPEELDHMPSYYRDQFADFWFQLWARRESEPRGEEERDWGQLRTPDGLRPVIVNPYYCDVMQQTTVGFCITLQDRGPRAVSR